MSHLWNTPALSALMSTSFYFGDDERKLADYAWYYENSGEDTHPVGLKQPNLWGLYDMHGNASEWVLDQYSEKYVGLRTAVSDGKQPIHWPTRLHPRTVRGASWDSDAADCRSAARAGSSADWPITKRIFGAASSLRTSRMKCAMSRLYSA